MASTPAANPTVHGGDNADGSYFQKTVCLHDWWLIIAENDVGGKGLAVAGVTSIENEARRVFSSAPISKRFDIFTLETVDGICVAIKGFINEQKTIENGFPSEVFSHFVFGFPPHWEQCVVKFFGGDSSIAGAGPESTSHSGKLAAPPGRVDAGTESSAPTAVHFDLEEPPHEQLSSEDRHDVEVAKQSSKPFINVAVDDTKVDDMPKHAAEEETGRANFGSGDFQSIGRPTNLESNQKKPVSRCFMKNKITKSSVASEAIENLDGASVATTQSGEKVDISEEDPRLSLGELFRSLSNLLRSKGKEKQMLESGLNCERNTVGSVPVPAVSKTASNTLENDNYKGKGRSMSHPSASEFQEPSTVDSVPAIAKTVSCSQNGNCEVGGRSMSCPSDPELEEPTTLDSVPAVSKTLSNTSQNDNCEVGGGSMSRPSDPELQEPTIVDFIPTVPKTLGDTSKNDYCEVGGRSMSQPSDSELQEPNSGNVVKRLDFDCLEDLEPTGIGKQGLTAQVGEGAVDAITENTSRKKTRRRTTNIVVGEGRIDAKTENTPRKMIGEGKTDAKKENTPRKKAKRKTTIDAAETPTPVENKKVSIISPESLNLKRSRTGRLLLPTMEFWRNQAAVYDLDRNITGIQDDRPVVTPSRDSLPFCGFNLLLGLVYCNTCRLLHASHVFRQQIWVSEKQNTMIENLNTGYRLEQESQGVWGVLKAKRHVSVIFTGILTRMGEIRGCKLMSS
ncbi:hypothetical protein ACFX2I_032539 [Malus domestica]